MLEKCVLTILEINWNQHLGHKKTKLNICHHMLKSSRYTAAKQVLSRRRKNENVRAKCPKINNARAKRAKILFFIVKYANLWSFSCARRRGRLSSFILTRAGGTSSNFSTLAKYPTRRCGSDKSASVQCTV